MELRIPIRPLRRREGPALIPRRGSTLVELLVGLSVVGVLLGLGTPLARGVLDRSAAVAAREEALGLVHHARALALSGGGATLTVVPDADVLILTDASGHVRTRLATAESGVDLRTTGAADSIRVRWNALGWGSFASRTLEFGRGGAVARLVISSRGRAERR